MMARLLLALVLLALGLPGATLPGGFGAVHPAAAQPRGLAAGRLLVADPSMPDRRFRHAVVLILSHGKAGTVGVIVNKVIARRDLADVLLGYGLPRAGVTGQLAYHYGGPVKFDVSSVLHSPEYRRATTVRRAGAPYAMTGDPKLYLDIARGKGPKRYVVLLGRSGWAPGQLEREMLRGFWFTIAYDAELVFGRDQADKWRTALKRRGVDL